MRFEKLTDKKIKITLSLEDMELNNVSLENIFSNSVSSQKLLQYMITKAEKEVGFSPGDSKLLVEAIMSSDRECTFTITKIIDENDDLNITSNSFIFKFDCLEDFISLCSFIKNMSSFNLSEFSEYFSLFLYNDTYYLYFVDSITFSTSFDYMKTIFLEFGKDVSCSIGLDGILNEYGKVIFKNNAIVQCLEHF